MKLIRLFRDAPKDIEEFLNKILESNAYRITYRIDMLNEEEIIECDERFKEEFKTLLFACNFKEMG